MANLNPLEYGKPRVFVSFKETVEELAHNMASRGIDLTDLTARSLIAVDYVCIERSVLKESGDYDLDNLFVRLGIGRADMARIRKAGSIRRAEVILHDGAGSVT